MMAGPVQFNTPPPPIMPNLSVPPPMAPPMGPPPTMPPTTHQQYFHPFHNRGGGGGHRNFFQPFRPYPRPGPPGAAGLDEFDGKRLRKSVMRKTVDYNAAIIKMLEARVWQRDFRDRRALQPDVLFYPNLEPPSSYVDNAINAVVTRFVKTATNKMRCPIFCMAWTPEGRRLVTGASSGEFTLWNGLTFNFETILQAHDSPVRTMVWSHNDVWMVTGDHAGYVKYWQSNMNNVKMFQAHKEAIRGLSFSPTDQKFVTCSDDGTLRIWDFGRCFEERILRGHGADVKCVHWHPQKSLIISGSKDNQQPVKLWDPKSGNSMATLHAHKSTVMDIKWNENGNWLVTASRDHLLKLFDIRNLSQEVQTFRGHKKEASSVAWHPFHEGLFCSGGSDGAILFWHVGADKEVGGIEQAHDSIVWTLAWHPLGHILCSGSNDHTSKFWTRNRPGDQMRDKYNLNTLPAGLAGTEDIDIDDTGIIPGMGPEDRVEQVDLSPTTTPATIPGLDFEGVEDKTKAFQKKVPYSKPIPKNFVAQWNETVQEDQSGGEDDDSHPSPVDPALAKMLATILEKTTVQGCIPVSDITPQAIIVYGKLLPVEEGDKYAEAIAAGSDALHQLILSGALEELDDVRPYYDDRPDVEYSPDNMDVDHMPDIEYPHPLPSSMFAKKGGPVAQPLRKSRFSDAEPGQMNMGGMDPSLMGDKDMRSLPSFLPSFPFPSGDQDLRMDPNFAQNQHDEDLRILMDIDRREEEMMSNNQMGSYGGPPDGPFGLPGMGDNQTGHRDVDARHLPFNVEQGNWHQRPPPQQWGPGDPIRPGLNNFGTRNFVSSGNFQNQSANFPNSSNDSPGNNNYGDDIGGPNAFGSNYSNSNRDDYLDDDDRYDDSWSGPNSQGSPMDRSQMGPRPQMGPGKHVGPRPMEHRLNMDPRQMGPSGPQMGQRPMDPNQRVGLRPQMGAGGPQMNQRPPLGARGPPMGPRGPQIGSRGPQMGPRGPLINQRSGPGSIQMDHRRSQDPRNPQAHHGGPPSEHAPTDSQRDARGLHLGQGMPPNVPGQQMGPRGPHLGLQDSSMVQGGPQMRQDLQGGPPMGQRISHRDLGGRPMGPGDLHRDQGPHMVPGDNHREPPPPMGPGGPPRDHRHQMGPGDNYREPPPMGPGGPQRDHRHQISPGDNHREPPPPMGPGGPLRDHRHQMGPGDNHREPPPMVPGGPQRDHRHQMGPGDNHREPPPMGPGGPQRERHPMGLSDRGPGRTQMGPGGPQRDRHQGGPGDLHGEPGVPPMGPGGPQREHHPIGPSDRSPGAAPMGGPQRDRDPHREPGVPPMGPGGPHRDRDQRHQMGPADSHRDPGGSPMASRGPQREHRSRDSHRDAGAGDLHRDRHQMGPGDSQREPGGSHRDRRPMGPVDSHRDPGGPMGPGDSHRESGGPPKSSEGSQRPPMGSGSPHMASRGQEMPPGGSPGNRRGPPIKHMGPGGHQMDPSKPFGLENAEIDPNQDMDDEEIQPHHSPGGPPFFRGRGFPRGRSPRTRMRGGRGAGRGGWRGASIH